MIEFVKHELLYNYILYMGRLRNKISFSKDNLNCGKAHIQPSTHTHTPQSYFFLILHFFLSSMAVQAPY